MGDIWTNKRGSESTSWDLDDEATTQVREQSNVGSEIYGTSNNAAGTIATYDSAAQAAASLVGSRYHLFDNKEFFFGTSKNYRMSYETDGSGFLIRTNPAIVSDYLFTIRNGVEDTFTIDTNGTIIMKECYMLPTDPKEGSFVYCNNEFYLYSNSY